MTNYEIAQKFIERYPSLELDDFRPIDTTFAKGQGIIIFLKNGDKFLFFPKETMRGEK